MRAWVGLNFLLNPEGPPLRRVGYLRDNPQADDRGGEQDQAPDLDDWPLRLSDFGPKGPGVTTPHNLPLV